MPKRGSLSQLFNRRWNKLCTIKLISSDRPASAPIIDNRSTFIWAPPANGCGLDICKNYQYPISNLERYLFCKNNAFDHLVASMENSERVQQNNLKVRQTHCRYVCYFCLFACDVMHVLHVPIHLAVLASSLSWHFMRRLAQFYLLSFFVLLTNYAARPERRANFGKIELMLVIKLKQKPFCHHPVIPFDYPVSFP